MPMIMQQLATCSPKSLQAKVAMARVEREFEMSAKVEMARVGREFEMS